MKNLEEVEIRLDRRSVISINMLFHPHGKGSVEYSYSDHELEDVKVTASDGATEESVRRYLMLIPNSLFDKIEDSLKAFLEGYKLFRVAISFMKL